MTRWLSPIAEDYLTIDVAKSLQGESERMLEILSARADSDSHEHRIIRNAVKYELIRRRLFAPQMVKREAA